MEDYISPSAARRQKEKEQAEQNRRRRRITFLRSTLMLAAMAALLALILSITIPIYRSHNEKKPQGSRSFTSLSLNTARSPAW